jgi:hypothetical protein
MTLSASSAVATQHHPKGIFTPFEDCPLSNPQVALCFIARLSGGEFLIGRRLVPVSKTIVLQVGLIPAGGANFNEYVLAGAEDGNTLAKVTLRVPGGVLGTNSLNRQTEVYATPELAGAPGTAKLNIASFVEEKGSALRLPLKFKIDNPELGGNCYIGSQTNPVILELTDGTTNPPTPNRPIKGDIGQYGSVIEDGEEMLADSGALLVDNAFAVPAATGCELYTSMVNAYIGLPSPSGHNAGILNASVEFAEVGPVKASE